MRAAGTLFPPRAPLTLSGGGAPTQLLALPLAGEGRNEGKCSLDAQSAKVPVNL
jgi:hypothetical protein